MRSDELDTCIKAKTKKENKVKTLNLLIGSIAFISGFEYY